MQCIKQVQYFGHKEVIKKAQNILYLGSLFTFCTLRKHCVYHADISSSSFKFIKMVKVYRI
jgi:hypothetical protein